MYPRPPGLTHAAEKKSAGEIFWVIKNGIKASGMPAWGGSHSDEDMWAMTAFVEKLPDLSASDYDRLLARAEASGVGHHAGGGGHGHDDGHSHGASARHHDDGHASAENSRHSTAHPDHDHGH